MKCTKCGKEIGKTDLFCQYCGTEVKKEEEKTKAVEKKTATKKAEKVEAVKVEEKKEDNKSGNGLAIASMVLGIIGIVFSLIAGPGAFLFPLLALIFGLCSKKSGYKTAGIVTSIVGFVIELIITILAVTLFSSLIGLAGSYYDYYNDYYDDYNYDYDYDYKNTLPQGEWTCVPYPSYDYTNAEKTTLKLNYDKTFMYGPTEDLMNNYYSGTYTYETEYEKNREYTDKYFIDIKAPVTKYVYNGVSQDATNANLNMEIQLVDDYDTSYIMFYNTYNTYKCER